MLNKRFVDEAERIFVEQALLSIEIRFAGLIDS